MLLTGPDHVTRELGGTYFFHSPNNYGPRSSALLITAAAC
jgi:hypothetical protein